MAQSQRRQRLSFDNDIEPILFDALYYSPVASYTELATITGFPKNSIGGYLSYLRRHAGKYGWTVPHVPRGRNRPEKWLFGVEVNGEGQIKTNDPTLTESLVGGTQGTLRMIASLGKHQGVALLGYTETRDLDDDVVRRLKEISDVQLFLARRAEAVIPMLRAVS